MFCLHSHDITLIPPPPTQEKGTGKKGVKWPFIDPICFGFFYMNLFPISSYYVMDIFSGYIVARKYLWQFSLLMIMYECQAVCIGRQELGAVVWVLSIFVECLLTLLEYPSLYYMYYRI